MSAKYQRASVILSRGCYVSVALSLLIGIAGAASGLGVLSRISDVLQQMPSVVLILAVCFAIPLFFEHDPSADPRLMRNVAAVSRATSPDRPMHRAMTKFSLAGAVLFAPLWAIASFFAGPGTVERMILDLVLSRSWTMAVVAGALWFVSWFTEKMTQTWPEEQSDQPS